MELLPEKIDRKTLRLLVLFQFIYSLSGLMLGSICIIGGTVLFFRGITGSTSWIAGILGMDSELSDAPPGVILFIVGLIIVLVTKFNVKAGRK